MNLKLGLVYLTGSGKKGQKDNLPKTITLGFYDSDATGSPFKYAKISLHTDDSIQKVSNLLIECSTKLNNNLLNKN